MDPALMADLMVTIHVSYIAFVIVGQLLILVCLAFRWGWIRNLWFRLAHLFAIAVVVFESTLHITCPLSTWEADYRAKAGQPFPLSDAPTPIGSCWGRFLDSIVFYDASDDVFFYCYVAFALIVLGTLVIAPPRLRKQKPLAV